MPTFKELVDEVALNLQGYTLRQDRSPHLTTNTTSTGTAITVADANNIAKGIIQIEDELIWVDSYNKATGVLTIPPYGRGYLGWVSQDKSDYSMETCPTCQGKNAKPLEDQIEDSFEGK